MVCEDIRIHDCCGKREHRRSWVQFCGFLHTQHSLRDDMTLPPSLPDCLLGDVQWDEEQPQGFSWCSKLSLQELGLPTQVRIRSQETRLLSMWKVKVATCLGTATLVNLPPIFPPVLLLSLCSLPNRYHLFASTPS